MPTANAERSGFTLSPIGTLREHGRATVLHWSLSAEPDTGEPLKGDTLIARALQVATA